MPRRCQKEGCNTQANYNFPCEKRGRYCSKHQLDGMVYVTSKKCEEDGCTKRPNYNFPGEKGGRYCSKHQLNGMVDVTNKICEREGCKKRATFNFPHEKRGRYCSKHQLNGMVDVKHKICEREGCNKQPQFNFPHKKEGRYCSEHKLKGMVDVTNKTCKTNMCPIRASNKKYEGYCFRCFIYTFPDKPVSRNYKTKENWIAEHIKNKFNYLYWCQDKIISGGCSRRRPDLLVDLGFQILIIEVDENQHTDYDCSCENKRIMEISHDLGHRKTIFIRFNPDDYIKNGIKITSCWDNNKLGICCIKKTKKKEWDERILMLEQQINYWIKHETNRTVETIQLFYDT